MPGDLTLGDLRTPKNVRLRGQTYRSRQMRVPWCSAYFFLALAREGLVICRDALLSESRLYPSGLYVMNVNHGNGSELVYRSGYAEQVSHECILLLHA